MPFGVIWTTLSLNLYFDSTVDSCHPRISEDEKPIVLVWFPPLGNYFDFNDCDKHFNIQSCALTYNKSQYNQAKAVIFYHKEIHWNLANMPKEPRPPTQKWIWYHVESPTNTVKIPGLENLFNLTLNYRRDADITVRNELIVKKSVTDGDFVLPKKDKLLCWIVSNRAQATGTATRESYYHQLTQHIKVHIFGAAFTGRRLAYKEYYSSIASCKFYLSFENSLHRDYITEKVNGPFVAGTVPVVMGPPRENYEQLMPADSFIHVDDFPNPKALAEFLLELDKNHQKYLAYFGWRRFYEATPHLLGIKNEFTQPICSACDHMSRDHGYSVVHDLYDWYFS